MVEKEFLNKIKKDFKSLIDKKDILGVILFGSYITNMETNRSDIDICVIAPNENNTDVLSFIWQEINVSSKKYDIKLFSELPLYIKIQIIEDGELIYSEDKYELYEYFYPFRKIWLDQKHRHHMSKEELLLF